MTKVVINTCFGGFGLSNEAFEDLLTRKGIEFEKTDSNFEFRGREYNYYRKGHLGDDDNYLWYYEFSTDRSDADLVAVVEKFGKEVNSWASDLKVVEIPDDVEWGVAEYDGVEHVYEKHRTWS